MAQIYWAILSQFKQNFSLLCGTVISLVEFCIIMKQKSNIK